jgi:SAM-dependent methyltransferase
VLGVCQRSIVEFNSAPLYYFCKLRFIVSVMFSFGRNWIEFSREALTSARVAQAREDFKSLFKGIPLSDKRFLDVGFGQGLSLFLSAEAGARAVGIDIDPLNFEAIKATSRFFPHVAQPSIERVSILDTAWVTQHERSFQIVHSWGVLHHTGALEDAFENCVKLLSPLGSLLVVSLYRSHWSSPLWSVIKKYYNYLPPPCGRILVYILYPVIALAKLLVTGRNPFRKERGMSFFYDVIDWVGGYPYEYRTKEEVEALGSKCGLKLVFYRPSEVPTGCNEYIFSN